jgi:methylmalonyl-CoA/ethylmalonyl-CoA epimerase
MPRKINQIGIVVHDIDKAIQFYQGILNLGPFQVIERPPETCDLHGKPSNFRLKTGIGMIEGLQLELIQVLEGRTLHSEFLETHGEGIHHFGYYIEDIDVEVLNLKKSGIEILARGTALGGIKWVYMDTIKLCGSITEFIELPKPAPRKPKSKPEDKK